MDYFQCFHRSIFYRFSSIVLMAEFKQKKLLILIQVLSYFLLLKIWGISPKNILNCCYIKILEELLNNSRQLSRPSFNLFNWNFSFEPKVSPRLFLVVQSSILIFHILWMYFSNIQHHWSTNPHTIAFQLSGFSSSMPMNKKQSPHNL